MKVKKVQKKKFKERERGLSKYNHEILGIVVVAFGSLLILSFYFDNSVGLFGRYMKGFLLGFMGLPSYVIPPIITVYGFLMIFKRNNPVLNKKLVLSSVLLLFVSAIIQTGYYVPKDYEGLSFLNGIYKFYDEGKNLTGGGVLGGMLSMPLLLVFQVVGTMIIFTTLSLINIILLTNISVAKILKKIKEVVWGMIEKLLQSFKGAREEEDGQDIPLQGAVPVEGRDGTGAKKGKSKIIAFKKKNDQGSKVEEERTQRPMPAQPEPEIQFENDEVPINLVVSDVKKTSKKEINQQKEDVREEILRNERLDIEYIFPPFDLLDENAEDGSSVQDLRNAALEVAKKLEETLASFNVEAKVVNISRGPAVTRYELQPSPGVKVSKIVNLSDDISLNLAASGVRIEAPIPGKAAIGIEVPNKEVIPVLLKEVLETPDFLQFSSKVAFAVGKDISGKNVIADIGRMPHMLIAGATGSGKSVCINSLVISLLYKASPKEVKLLMIDPKVVELGIYNGIPHLLIPVVTDPRKAAGALNWAVQEMVQRYKLFADKGVRDIKGYNAMVKDMEGEDILPQIVIIIDELADLMMVAPNDVEDAICRLAQMARAAGMHLVIATQRPSVDVITGVIKANIPSRISFAVSSQIDSRTILDMAGAEKLLGKGDMLFYPIGEPKPVRVKGAFVSDKEVENVVEFIKEQGKVEYDPDIIEEINSEEKPEESDPGDNDELLPQAIEMVVEAGQASVSLIQRKFKVGYARAARIVDQMEERGIVGKFEGSKPRQVLISRQQWMEMQMAEIQKAENHKKESHKTENHKVEEQESTT